MEIESMEENVRGRNFIEELTYYYYGIYFNFKHTLQIKSRFWNDQRWVNKNKWFANKLSLVEQAQKKLPNFSNAPIPKLKYLSFKTKQQNSKTHSCMPNCQFHNFWQLDNIKMWKTHKSMIVCNKLSFILIPILLKSIKTLLWACIFY